MKESRKNICIADFLHIVMSVSTSKQGMSSSSHVSAREQNESRRYKIFI